MNVEQDFFDGMLEALRPRYRGPYISFKEASVKITKYTEKQQRDLKKETMKLYLESDESLRKVKYQLDKLHRRPVPITADGDCMFEAVLNQIKHPKDYTAISLRKQVAMYLIKNVEVFNEFIEPICVAKSLDDNVEQSFESYVTNVYKGTIWGDNVILSAIGRMWNMSVSIISPEFKDVMHIFHNNPPQVVLIANGGFLESKTPTSHFSATGK